MEKKEVKSEKGSKFLVDILNLIKKGLNPSKICIHLNITPQKLNYYLSSLKRENIISKKGYGVWEVNPIEELKKLTHKGSLSTKNIRGHAYIWKIKANKLFNWESLLEENNIYSELKGLKNTPRIILNKRKVWLGKNYITIFEPKDESFFGLNSTESDKEAIYQLVNTIDLLKKALQIDFKYKFTCSRHHYGHINSIEAKRVIRNGRTILIKNKRGFWFSIDFSQNKYKESEMIGTIGENDADIQSLQYQNYMNSHERTNFKVTPEFTLDAINKVTQNQLMFSKNIETHMEVLKGIKEAIKELKDTIHEGGNPNK